MADLSITAANVVVVSGSPELGTAGASGTAGQLVYKDSAGLFQKSDMDGTTAQKAAYGIALHAFAANQPLAVLKDGIINPGATVGVGTIYVGSTTAGGIAPSADLASGSRVIIVGYGITASQIQLAIKDTTVSVP